MERIIQLESDYAQSLKNLLIKGKLKENRTGVDTYAFQHQYFHLNKNEFPILRGKKMFPEKALIEMCWMLLGRNDIEFLHKHGVGYWDSWALEDGTIGKTYGYQFRNFNGKDILIEDAIKPLIKTPDSRRIILNIWNHNYLEQMNLPPCVLIYHLVPEKINANQYELTMHVTQRSADSFVGVPYDFLLARFFQEILIGFVNKIFGYWKYVIGDIHYTCNDYHYYVNQTSSIAKYLDNYDIDKLKLFETSNNAKFHIDMSFDIEKTNKVQVSDFNDFVMSIVDSKNNRLLNYDSYPFIKTNIAV